MTEREGIKEEHTRRIQTIYFCGNKVRKSGFWNSSKKKKKIDKKGHHATIYLLSSESRDFPPFILFRMKEHICEGYNS